MSTWLVPLSSSSSQDYPGIGRKAANLAGLLSAGFPNPAGLCVILPAFTHALAPWRSQIENVLAIQI